MKDIGKIIKEVDLTNRVSDPLLRDAIVLNDRPTLKDIKRAEKNNYLIRCRLQGTKEERAEKAQKLKEELGEAFISSSLFLG